MIVGCSEVVTSLSRFGEALRREETPLLFTSGLGDVGFIGISLFRFVVDGPQEGDNEYQSNDDSCGYQTHKFTATISTAWNTMAAMNAPTM